MPTDTAIPLPPDPVPARLERPADGRLVAGVCAAIARHQRLDVRLVRAAAVVLVLLGGLGVIAYFAGLLLIPAEGHAEPIVREGLDGPERTTTIVLGALATIALLDLPDQPLSLFGAGGRATVAVLAVAGAAVLVLRRDRAAVQAATVTAEPGDAPTLVGPPAGDDGRGRGRAAMILGGVLVAFAATGAVLGALDGDVRWDVALCAATIAIGVLLVVSAPLGGARVLVPLGVLLALLAGGAAATDLNLRGGVGDRLEHPAALATGTTDYTLAAGRLMVDLRDADLPPGVTDVRADVGFGQLVVRVPAGARVELDTHVSAGEIDGVGRYAEGTDVRRRRVLTGPAGAPIVRVRGHVAFGELRLLRADQSLPRVSDDGRVRGLPEATS